MREFSVPPVVTVGDAANLTDPVWDNAGSGAATRCSSGAATARAAGATSPAPSSATRWSRSPAA